MRWHNIMYICMQYMYSHFPFSSKAEVAYKDKGKLKMQNVHVVSRPSHVISNPMVLCYCCKSDIMYL